MSKPSITIFGVGKVGSALKKALHNSGYLIRSTYTRGSFPQSAEELGDVVFLTVHDRDIKDLSEKISTNFPTLMGKHIVHCSGTLDSTVLQSVSNNGAATASFHPLKAVTKNDDSFEHVWFDMDGDQKTVEVLKKMAEALKAHSFEIKAEAKPLLHAAAVVSANYVVTLMKMATEIAKVGGIDQEIALKALLPLTRSSVSNIQEKGIEGSLTGPIARGDVDTIARHLKKLEQNKELLDLYKTLGRNTLQLATDLDEKSLKDLQKLLE
ncbi:MAG: DUF2520 domain-containing protein [Balneola sp.]